MKFGFYYSHAFDWADPDAPGNDWERDNPGGDRHLHGGDRWWEKEPAQLESDRDKRYEMTITTMPSDDVKELLRQEKWTDAITLYRSQGASPERISVTGGFAEVSDKGLTVLAESAGVTA